MLQYNDAIQHNTTTLECYICHDEAPTTSITWFKDSSIASIVPVCSDCTTDTKAYRHTQDYQAQLQHTLNERS